MSQLSGDELKRVRRRPLVGAATGRSLSVSRRRTRSNIIHTRSSSNLGSDTSVRQRESSLRQSTSRAARGNYKGREYTEGELTKKLLSAARKGQTIEVSAILALLPSGVNAASQKGWTALHLSVRSGHNDIVRMLLEQPLQDDLVNRKTLFQVTPLYLGSRWGHVESCRLLLDAGARVNDVDEDGESALWVAASSGHEDVVKLLIEHGADITVSTNSGKSALQAACEGGHYTVAKLLLSGCRKLRSKDVPDYSAHDDDDGLVLFEDDSSDDEDVSENGLRSKKTGKSQNSKDKDGRRAKTPRMCRRLLRLPSIDINHASIDGQTALSLACTKGYSEIVRLLLGTEGCDVNVVAKNGVTPLFSACRGGYEDIFHMLIGAGADPTVETRAGGGDPYYTPLMIASIRGNANIVDTLLKIDSALCVVSSKNASTPFHIAARRGHTDVLRVLLAHHPKMTDPANNMGETPLHLACSEGFLSTVRFLVESGARVNAMTSSNETPVFIAAKNGFSTVVSYLLEHSDVDPEAGTEVDGTCLAVACREGHEDVVDVLIEGGADIHYRGNRGWTCLHWAAWCGHISVVLILLESGADCVAKGWMGDMPLDCALQHNHHDVCSALQQSILAKHQEIEMEKKRNHSRARAKPKDAGAQSETSKLLRRVRHRQMSERRKALELIRRERELNDGLFHLQFHFPQADDDDDDE